MPKKIDVMIIGAQKAGTTSLLRYLGEHPRCVAHPQKEFAYFLDSTEYKNNYENAFVKYYSEQNITEDSILIAKSASLSNNESAIRSLYEHNPNCELIFLLRDPVDRAYSSYWMEKNAGSVNYDFDNIVNIMNDPKCWEYEVFLKFGMYSEHLKSIYKYFPKHQVNFVFFDDLKNDATGVCKKIFTKLNIDPEFIPQTNIKHNQTVRNRSGLYSKMVVKALRKESVVRKVASPIIPTYRAYKFGNLLRNLNKTKDTYLPMSETSRLALAEFYKPYIKELAELLETDLTFWNNSQKVINKTSDKGIRYKFLPIQRCNMCGDDVKDHKVLGKRLNQSQGKRPRSKTGLTTNVCICAKCGLIYCNPLPIPLDIQDHYGIAPENYWKAEYFELNANYFKNEIAQLKDLLPKDKWRKALDIGAGLGKTILSLNEEGFDTYGIEPSKPFHEKAISTMKIDANKLFLGAIEDADYAEDFFDFITFGAVLEHLYSPSEAIRKAMRWLKPGGIMHIEVPSSKWLINKIANVYYQNIYFSDFVANLSPMHAPYHLYEFGLKSFEENSKINHYKIARHDYYVCETYLPKVLDFALKPAMKYTNTGMQLCIWLKKD